MGITPETRSVLPSSSLASAYINLRNGASKMRDINKILKSAPFRTPLHLKERRVGKWSIKIEELGAGTSVPLISMRTSFHTGQPMLQIRLSEPLQIHKLMHDGDLITSDIPQEVYSQFLAFKKARGRVLVGGLGIGMAAAMIADMPKVEEVTVVEFAPEVIEMMHDQLPKTKTSIKIVEADLFSYLKNCPDFDFAYFDIWSPTGEGAWNDYIVPLRRAVRRHHGAKSVECWAENEMQGQVRASLLTALNPPDEVSTRTWIDSFQTLWVFFQAAQSLTRQDEIEELIGLYLTKIGTSKWEKTFPWDQFKEKKR